MQKVLVQLMGLPATETLPVALECDDVHTLKRVALETDSVLIAPLVAVSAELSAGTLIRLETPGFPPAYSDMGVVILKGRTPSPMAQHAIGEVSVLLQA
jgi:DNA-binding transcriptional LysR family regulator